MPAPADDLNPSLGARQAPPVSVVILTYNEEGNIAAAIESCRWCDDIHVLDSGSDDKTCQMAGLLGAQVHSHRFQSFGRQRNWAIDHIATKHAWNFHLDADERFTEPLVKEMLKELGPEGDASHAAAYLVPSKMIFMNKWLKHSGGYPAYQVRLFHREKCRFVDFGHGQREDAKGPVATLVNPYLHYNFSKGLADWFYKHNKYSDQEAGEAMEVLQRKPAWGEMLGGDRVLRRRAVKNLSYRLRARSLWRFLYMYVLRLGWLDGNPGLQYCMMMAMYEYWTELKLREKRADWPVRTEELARRLMNESRV